MVRLLIIALLLNGLTAQADMETDKVAHFGVSYAIQTGLYGFSKRALRLNKKDALVFSIFTAALITTAAEYMGGPQSPVDGGDIKANLLGIGAASITIHMFDF